MQRIQNKQYFGRVARHIQTSLYSSLEDVVVNLSWPFTVHSMIARGRSLGRRLERSLH
jgi:hypothetical protein